MKNPQKRIPRKRIPKKRIPRKESLGRESPEKNPGRNKASGDNSSVGTNKYKTKRSD